MATSFYTTVDGLSTVNWHSLNVADATASFNQGFVDAVSSTNGVWSVTTDADGAAHPAWDFTPTLPTTAWALAVRLTTFSHPAAAQNIAVYFGASAGATGAVQMGAGLCWITGTTNAYGGNYVETNLRPVTARNRATVVAVRSIGQGFNVAPGDGYGAYGEMVTTTVTESVYEITVAAGLNFQRLTLEVSNPGPLTQTYGFKPEYSIVLLSNIM